MDITDGPSWSKRKKSSQSYFLEDSDLEIVIYGSSDDDHLLLSDSSDDEEGGAGLHSSSRVTGPSLDSLWKTSGTMRSISFTKENQFFANPGSNIIDYFDFFFDDTILTMICEKTNAQAERLYSKPGLKSKSRLFDWTELTVPTLRVFFGLLFHMGTIQMHRLRDYWDTDRLFSIPIFRKTMSRNKFMLIMRCLHFSSDEGGDDELLKIHSVVSYFNNKMKTCYYPDRELFLNESMVLSRGGLKHNQFLSSKRHRHGVKLYMLTEPNGVIVRFCVELDVTARGHSDKVVMRLVEDLLNNGHILYLHHYYNSYTLAKQLLDKDTYCTGTLSNERKDNPPAVVTKKLQRGENFSMFRDGVHIGKWRDNQSTTYLTTQFEQKMVKVAHRGGTRREKPEVISEYNKIMDSVDKQDKLLHYYPCENIRLRWYLKVAIHIFHMLFMNSYIMYNKYSGMSKMSLYDYRLSIIGALLPENDNPQAISIPIIQSESRTHKISRILQRNKQGRLMRRMCSWCKEKLNKRRDASWLCEYCDDRPALCFECFDEYHANKL